METNIEFAWSQVCFCVYNPFNYTCQETHYSTIHIGTKSKDCIGLLPSVVLSQLDKLCSEEAALMIS